jgi:hypothetical protein
MPQFAITNSSTTTPVQVSSVAKNFRTATIIACKTVQGPSASPNTGRVQIGVSANNNEQPLEFNPGDERVIHAAAGQMLDLSQYYLQVANANDGIVVIYQ